MATQTHLAAGRFRPALDEPTLIEAVAAVCRELRPHAPHTAPPAAFDALLEADSRRELPVYPGVPRSRSVRRRLAGLGWYELLALTFDPGRSTEHYLALRRRRPGRHVEAEECVVALRTVAARLNVRTVRPHEFAQVRHELVDEAKRAWLHGTDQEWWFPTAAQVEGVFRTDEEPGWDLGLMAAGLEPRPAIGGSLAGVPVVQAIELFLTELGCLPWSDKPLRSFAAQRGFSLATTRAPWSEYIEVLRLDRALLGLWTPPAAPPAGQRPRVVAEPDAEPAVPRRHKLLWQDIENLITGVMKAYDLAAEMNRTLTQPLHRQLAKENRGVIPSPSVVERNAKKHGKTAEWVREQAKRRRRRAKGR